MTLSEIIAKYQDQTAICATTDYSDRKSIKAHNKAVDKMYKLIQALQSDFQKADIGEFAQLLNVSKNMTNLWVATQMLEKLSLEKDIVRKSLSIIREEARSNRPDAIGFQMWLKDWEKKIQVKL
jgi:hypothetical protein